MPKNLLRQYENIEEYNKVKCTLEFGTISLINSVEDTKYGKETEVITSVYKVINKSNKIKLFNSATLVNSMSSMKINGVEVEPTNEFQFDKYENATIECEFCNLTSIPNYAFSGCTFLTSIEIPNSVTSIGTSAFTKCYSLREIEIPDSVTSIGNEAFEFCYSLSSIEIPNGVESIGNDAFYYCR